jgi:iron-sulfur cluster repair protein YtfE (RIC family)
MLAGMTQPPTPAPTAADAAAADAVRAHHAQLAAGLAARVSALVEQAEAGPTGRPAAARDELIGFCRSELLPHAAAEEQVLYPPAQADPQAHLLVDSMIAEHRALASLVDVVATAPSMVRAAGAATALRELFGLHLAEENDVVLPLLVADPDVRLVELLAGMHELLSV